MARLFVAIGGLIVLVLTAALVAPHFVDWGSWRADFEREAGRILGRDVTVRGEASARLLPFPSVTFTDVEVAGAQPGETAMTVETFSMDAELAPFLRGEVLIFDMRLERPTAFLSVDGDGRVDWAVRPHSPYNPSQITLERMTINDGAVTIRHAASGREHRLTNIDAELSARSLAGPWRINGALLMDGMPLGLSLSTGIADADGRMRLRTRADPHRYGFLIESDGHVSLNDGVPGYQGQFRVAARTPEVEQQARAPEPAYRLSGDFSLGHERLEASRFRFETGPVQDPYVAEGHASISLADTPSFEVVADGAQIRFDEGISLETGALALEDRLAALRDAIAAMPRPEIPGRISMSLPAVVVGDTTIRNVRLAAEPAEEGWHIGEFSAELPGRTTLEANGDLLARSEDLGFRGDLVIAVGQPSGFASWLARDVDEAIRRLPSAGFSATVELSQDAQQLDDLELILGDARFSGQASLRRPAGGRPSMSVELDGGRLDVAGLAAFTSLFVSDAGDRRLADYDVDLEVAAGPVMLGGVEADRVDTMLRVREGTVEIDRLSVGGLAGAAISATGTLEGVGERLGGTLDLSLLSGDLHPLVSQLSERFPEQEALAALRRRASAFPDLLTDAELHTVLRLATEDDVSRLEIEGQGQAGGTRLALNLTALGALDDFPESEIDLKLTAGNDDAAPLYALYGLPVLPGIDLVAGPVETRFELSGRPSAGASAKFDAQAEGMSAEFDGRISANGGERAAEGALRVQADDIMPWLLTAGFAMPGMELGAALTVGGEISLTEGLLVVSGLDASLDGDAIAGDLNARMVEGLPHISGSIALDNLDLGMAFATVLGEEALVGDGETWPDVPFAGRSAPAFTTDLEIVADRVLLGAGEMAAPARMNAVLSRDGLRIGALRASYRGGRAEGSFEIRNDQGTGLFSAQMRLDNVLLEELLREEAISGRADFSANLSASGKSLQGMVAALSGSGTATIDGLVISGLDADALPAILARAEDEGVGIDAARTASFAPPMLRAGRFEATNRADLALTISSGVVRAPPVRLESPNATISADLRAEIETGALGADGTIAFAPGDEAIVGADPSVRFAASGPSGDISVSLDFDPLAQFLAQRALEREQARVEAMQAQLLERQRLRREVRYYAALADERVRVEEEARQAEEEARAREEAEEEARRAAEEAERLAREAEEASRAAEEAPPAPIPPFDPNGVDRTPLEPPAQAPSAGGAFDPDAISDLLRRLQ